MSTPVESLQRLGFGEIEARLYVALLLHPSSTGYELAKAAEVTRPNVYPALDRLERRGAVMRVRSGAGAVRYVALAAEEVCGRIGQDQAAAVQDAQAVLSAMAVPDSLPPGPLFSTGYDNLLAQVRRLCGRAHQEVLLGTTPTEAAQLDDATADVLARGVGLGCLCLCACPTPCGHCRGAVVRTALQAADTAQARWLLCIRDDEEAVIGEIGRDGSAQCTVSSQRPIVALGVAMMCYAAALAGGGETPGAANSAQFRRWAGQRPQEDAEGCDVH